MPLRAKMAWTDQRSGRRCPQGVSQPAPTSAVTRLRRGRDSDGINRISTLQEDLLLQTLVCHGCATAVRTSLPMPVARPLDPPPHARPPRHQAVLALLHTFCAAPRCFCVQPPRPAETRSPRSMKDFESLRNWLKVSGQAEGTVQFTYFELKC